MARNIRRRLRAQFSAWVALSCVFVLVFATPAAAIEAVSPITLSNGELGLSTVGVAKGGTGVTAIADNQIFLGTGSDTITSTTLTTCTGTGKAVTFDASGNSFGCNDIAGVKAVLAFTSESPIDLGDNTTPVFIGLGGRVSLTEAKVQTPIDAGTLTNLRCIASAAMGASGATVTVRSGACGSLGDSSVTLDVTTTTAVADASNTVAVTAGQCVSLSVVRKTSGNPAAVFVNCSLAKTAD